MPIYFIRAGKQGLVKIGLAQEPEKRLRELQSGSPVRLSIIRVIQGGHETESWLHRHFAALRQHGEWFTFNDEMLSVDPRASGCTAEASSEPIGNRPADRLKEARQEAGFETAATFALAVGVKPVTYRTHESGSVQISADQATAYAERLGVCPAWLLFGEPYPREGLPQASPVPIGVLWATPESIESERKTDG